MGRAMNPEVGNRARSPGVLQPKLCIAAGDMRMDPMVPREIVQMPVGASYHEPDRIRWRPTTAFAVSRFTNVSRSSLREFKPSMKGEAIASRAHQEPRENVRRDASHSVGGSEVWRFSKVPDSKHSLKARFTERSSRPGVPLVDPRQNGGEFWHIDKAAWPKLGDHLTRSEASCSYRHLSHPPNCLSRLRESRVLPPASSQPQAIPLSSHSVPFGGGVLPES